MITNEQAMKIAEDSFNAGYEGAKDDMGQIFEAFMQWYWGETGINLEQPFKQFAATYKHPKP